jgi:hypothetical protein
MKAHRAHAVLLSCFAALSLTWFTAPATAQQASAVQRTTAAK